VRVGSRVEMKVDGVQESSGLISIEGKPAGMKE